jgi:molybdopterin converting factor small subunit
VFLVTRAGGTDTTVRVTIKFMSVARQRAGAGIVELTCRERTLKDVLEAVVGSYGIADIILTENGEVRPWARVLVNGRSHELVGGLGVELHDGDSVALIYPYTENF